MRSYDVRYRHGNALTDDFRREVEAASVVPLNWFFDQWLHRAGVAEVDVRWQWDPGRQLLELTVAQGANVAPFRLGLVLDVTDAQGRVERIRVTVPAARVATLSAPIRLSAAPRGISFDGDASVLGTIEVRSP